MLKSLKGRSNEEPPKPRDFLRIAVDNPHVMTNAARLFVLRQLDEILRVLLNRTSCSGSPGSDFSGRASTAHCGEKTAPSRQNAIRRIIRMAAGCILTGHPGSKMEIPAKGKRWRKKYVSLSLVHSYWTNLGDCREIGDARAHNDLLDDCARHHRIDHRRRRYPHVFAPDKRTISSRRPHFFHTGRDTGSLHLL